MWGAGERIPGWVVLGKTGWQRMGHSCEVCFSQSSEGKLAPLAGLKPVPGLLCSQAATGSSSGASWPALVLPAVLVAWDRPFCVRHRRNSLEKAIPGKQVVVPAGPASSSLTLPLRSKNAFSDGRVRDADPAGPALSWGVGLGTLQGS